MIKITITTKTTIISRINIYELFHDATTSRRHTPEGSERREYLGTHMCSFLRAFVVRLMETYSNWLWA
jgi:hypothetical protein